MLLDHGLACKHALGHDLARPDDHVGHVELGHRASRGLSPSSRHFIASISGCLHASGLLSTERLVEVGTVHFQIRWFHTSWTHYSTYMLASMRPIMQTQQKSRPRHISNLSETSPTLKYSSSSHMGGSTESRWAGWGATSARRARTSSRLLYGRVFPSASLNARMVFQSTHVKLTVYMMLCRTSNAFAAAAVADMMKESTTRTRMMTLHLSVGR